MKRSHRWRHSLAHSLQWRLVLLFVVLALATTVVFLGGMQRLLQSGWQAYVKPMAADYADRLAAEIGSPPDKDRAIAIAARLPVTVRIDGPRMVFDSHPNQRRRDHEDWSLVRSTADGHRIRFGLAGPLPEDRPRLFGWITLVLLLTLTAGAYAAVRRLLQPIGEIGAGVARFGRGEFDAPIALRRDDELGELAQRINAMAASLRGMLDAKRALLLAISHELRSPLTRARINAELVPEGPERAALLRDLGEMRDLIGDLLESERLAQGHAALQAVPLELAALVHEALAQHFAGVPLDLELDAGLGPVDADPVRLKLLVRNLVANALRHGAGGARPPRVVLRRAEGGAIELSVRDFGPGVDEAQLARLAEPFYRPDGARTRASGGAGLGLYLCRLVAEAHGGSLRLARAEPGFEATMVFRSSSTP